MMSLHWSLLVSSDWSCWLLCWCVWTELHTGCLLGKTRQHVVLVRCSIAEAIFCVFVCVVPKLVVAIWLPVLTQSCLEISHKCWPSVLPTFARRGERGARARGCSVTSCKLLSSDNLWTRWGGGVQWKNTPLILIGVFALHYFFSAQHLFPLVLFRGGVAEAREEEHCVRMCINAH